MATGTSKVNTPPMHMFIMLLRNRLCVSGVCVCAIKSSTHTHEKGHEATCSAFSSESL